MYPQFHDDLWDIFIGKKLGSGAFRDVYDLKFFHGDTDAVLKVQREDRCFDNILEYDFWWRASPELQKWLAPCIYISKNGKFLVQVKVTEISPKEMPAKVPACLGDVYYSNWGKTKKNKIVCCDYAITNPTYSMRLVKTE